MNENLRQLRERVAALSGPDMEVDYLAWLVLDPEHSLQLAARGITAKERVTASIDAAFALVERVLPEANCYGVEYDPLHGWQAYVSRNQVASGHWLKEAEASTAPRAILLATIDAKLSEFTP